MSNFQVLRDGSHTSKSRNSKVNIALHALFLQQTEDSAINRFFKLQLEMPTRGDWASMCLKDLDELEIKEKLESIKLMTKNKFSSILRDKTRIRTLKLLSYYSDLVEMCL